MSLFKTKEWWRVECGTNETFDKQHLLVAPLLGPQKSDVIVVGSNKGVLRIYNPLTRWMETKLPLSYMSKDLIIEKQLPDSIVDLKAGKFLSGSQNYCLAVLLPEKLIVYNVQLKEDSVSLGDKCCLEVEYEHQLLSVAMSLTIGPFGGGHERDFLCVQFVDGTLFFLEQELYSFIRILKNRLQHEPLVYLEANDVFVTQNADWVLAFYRYQNIAEFGKNSNESETLRTVEADWKYNLGEAVIAINSVALSTLETGILVISERNFYYFHDSHLSLKFTKRYAYNVLCIHSYIIEPDGKLVSIVVTDTKAVMIYEGTSLRWTAEVSFIPIAVTVAHSQRIEGLIVILSEDGHLEVCFLGTQPSLYVAPSVYRRRYNYANAESELTDLRSRIKKCVHYGKEVIPNVFADFEIQVNADINLISGEEVSRKIIENKEEDVTFVNTLKLQSNTFLSNVQVYVEMFKPWVVDNDNWWLSNLCGQYSYQSLINFESEAPMLSAELDIIVTYENDECDIHIVKKHILLSMSKLCKVGPPENMELFQIAIKSEEFVGYIFKKLFNELISDFSENDMSNTFSLELIQQKKVVTLSFELPINEINFYSNDQLAILFVINNIINNIPNKGTKNLKICIKQDKMHLILDFMMAYSNNRIKIKNIKKEITLLTSQLRNIIRKMIHIRERNFQLSVDSGLLRVLKISCQNIFTLLENFIDAQTKLISAAHNFYCLLQLILNLQRFNLHEDIWADLASAVGFQLQSELEVVWEDVTKYAFGTIFGESLKYLEDQFVSLSTEKLDTTEDIKRMGKFLFYIIERNILVVNQNELKKSIVDSN